MLRAALVALVLAATTTLAPAPAAACLWDIDTLKEESLGNREVAAVVTGDLGKHSAAFYEAKVTYTRALIDRGGAPAERYDDLAVALAKTGKLDEALIVLTDKERAFPGQYTTHANRGTFLAGKGDLAGALVELRRAVAINPKAHFGREHVQIQLLEWMGRLGKDPALVRRETFLGQVVPTDGMVESVRTRPLRGRNAVGAKPAELAEIAALDANVVALVGLIRFGDGERSPHLWFALGYNLAARGDSQLAVNAFRQAERLGHPLAAGQGGIRASIIRAFNAGAPTLEPDGPGTIGAWAKATPVLDAAWAKGQATMTRRQAGEDRRITKRRLRAVFGY
ncbi:MAG: hypothetical protein KBG28_16060 [Kofleriaceae bacterium]|nr:hypothetical protein [Kofleriaceae bacterium]MBP9205485.1 hypothetical protein [Kofleriaceae bacterium]